MKKLLILLFLVNTLNANCQKVFLDENYKPVIDSLKAKYFKVTLPDEKPGIYNETIFLISGYKISGTLYDKMSGEVLKAYTWHDNGNLKSEINYSEKKINGLLTTYWKNGKIKRKDTFMAGLFEIGTCYDSLGNEVKHYDYEIMPEYNGGNQKLLTDIAYNIRYPDRSIDAGIQGMVVSKFIIKEDGTIDKITIIKGLSPELDKEAVRVVSKLKNFKPGLRDGEPASFDYSLPITFRLQ